MPVADALAAVLAQVTALPEEDVPLSRAAGRILARGVESAIDLPPFPSSSMDGYAVRAADTPGVLPVVGHSAAGRPAQRSLGAGEAIEISTGAVVPEGADAVIPVERVDVRPDEIAISTAVGVDDNIRHRGGDVRAGDEVLAAGNILTAARVGAIAACGIETITARRIPRVAVLVTGSELRPPGQPLAPGQIYESNGIMLARVLEEAGAEVERLAPAEDTEAALERALERALEADVVVTSGGVSVGPHDLVRRARSAAWRRRGLLGCRDAPRQAACVRRPRRNARLRPARQPALVARRRAPLRHPGAARAPGTPRSRAAVSTGERRPGGRPGGPSATTLPARGSPGPRQARCSTRSPGRSRT